MIQFLKEISIKTSINVKKSINNLAVMQALILGRNA